MAPLSLCGRCHSRGGISLLTRPAGSPGLHPSLCRHPAPGSGQRVPRQKHCGHRGKRRNPGLISGQRDISVLLCSHEDTAVVEEAGAHGLGREVYFSLRITPLGVGVLSRGCHFFEPTIALSLDPSLKCKMLLVRVKQVAHNPFVNTFLAAYTPGPRAQGIMMKRRGETEIRPTQDRDGVQRRSTVLVSGFLFSSWKAGLPKAGIMDGAVAVFGDSSGMAP